MGSLIRGLQSFKLRIPSWVITQAGGIVPRNGSRVKTRKSVSQLLSRVPTASNCGLARLSQRDGECLFLFVAQDDDWYFIASLEFAQGTVKVFNTTDLIFA